MIQQIDDKYKGIVIDQSVEELTAGYPRSDPQPNVIPKNTCGKKVNRFVDGYKIIRNIESPPNRVQNGLKDKRIAKLMANRPANKTIANLFDSLFDAKGLSSVLATKRSISLSQISLIIQPADLIVMEPRKNFHKTLQSTTDLFESVVLLCSPSAILKPHGMKSKRKPAGLCNRHIKKEYLIF